MILSNVDLKTLKTEERVYALLFNVKFLQINYSISILFCTPKKDGISKLGLSLDTAKNLYLNKAQPDVVNRLWESPVLRK